MTRLSAKDKRYLACKAIVDTYFNPETGARTRDVVSFAELCDQVVALVPLGKSAAWIRAVDKWLDTIGTAEQTFMDHNDLWNVVGRSSDDFTRVTGDDYRELFHWAVLQGIVPTYGI